MAEQTPNLGLTKPARSELYDVAVTNENMDKIDMELGGVASQLAQTSQEVEEVAINVKSFGAVGDGVTDDTQAFKQALLVADSFKFKLLIPNGEYLITDLLDIHCNIECYGKILIPNNLKGSVIRFPRGEYYTYTGSVALNAVSKGKAILDFKELPEIPKQELSNYYFHISSTEKLITRLGSQYTEPYYKNESGEITQVKNGIVYAKSNVLYDYNDLSLVTITLTKKQPVLNIRGLKIDRVSKGPYVREQTLLRIERPDVVFEDLEVMNGTVEPLSAGINLNQTINIRFNNLKVKNVFNSLGLDTYPILNNNSSFIYFNHYTYTEDKNNSTIEERGYASRHGNFIYFKHCNLYGVDDHFGSNYFLEDCQIGSRGITFGGSNLYLLRVNFSEVEYPIMNRTDTPHNTGELIIDDCTFDSCRYILRHQINTDDSKILGFNPSFFDKIIFRKIKVKNSEKYGGGTPITFTRALFTTSTYAEVEKYTVNIGNIIFEDIETDLLLVYMPQSCKFSVDRIKVDRVINTTTTDLSYRGVAINPDSTRPHEVRKIEINESDNMSILISTNAIVDEVTFKKLVLSGELGNRYLFSRGSTLVHLDGCTFKDNTKLENQAFLGFRGCLFTGARTQNLMTYPERLLYSLGNIAEIETPSEYIPQLNGYVNESYYKQ